MLINSTEANVKLILKCIIKNKYLTMPDFWENVLRFPRFFISSVIGLLLTILGPFLNLLNRPKTALIFIALLFIFVILLVITLKSMLGINN